MVNVGFGALTGLVTVLLAIALPVIAVWLLVKALSGIAWVLGALFGGLGLLWSRIGGFVKDTAVDCLQLGGSLLTAAALLPLAILNVIIGRWSAASHYGRAIRDETWEAGLCLYRVALGNPLHALGLGTLTEGLERRLPEVVERVPMQRGSASRSTRGKQGFEGYKVTGTLPAGGSGARLYLAKPSPEKVSMFQAAGHPDPGQVVIKSFALAEGSTLPQIVRENRALASASKLGLVLEHSLTNDSFFYVMPFVPGEGLNEVTARMHAHSGEEGLSDRHMLLALHYAADLCATLQRFHAGGLWHKDIKPSNIIVSNGKVHLVDLGLVTPLSSAMTLTTHGTEYYRDPEMVRLAMQGVKVQEVDGVKFDLYSLGAVLYTMIENDFPAQGSLSKLSRRCPDALKMVIRRAMAEMGGRYGSAGEMLADLRALMATSSPYDARVADLPSLRGESVEIPIPPAAPPAIDLSSRPAPDLHARTLSARERRRAARAEAKEAHEASWAGHRDARRKARKTSTGPRHVAAALLLLWAGFLFMTVSGGKPTPMPTAPAPAQDLQATLEWADLAPRITKMRSGSQARVTRSIDGPDETTLPAAGATRAPAPSSFANRLAAMGSTSASPADSASTPIDLLVVRDRRAEFEAAHIENLESLIREHGVTPHGLGAETSGAMSLAEADALHAVGLNDPEHAKAELQRLLDEEKIATEIEGVLYLSNGTEDRIEYHLLERGSTTPVSGRIRF